MKVLVVDDDEKIVKVLEAYLLKEGYTVEKAVDGKQAVEKTINMQPDVVLLDVMLPYMDGFSVCAEIRRHSDVPIIMLTARDEETDRIVGLEIGADDYVPKPFSPREVMARIKAILRRTGQAGRSGVNEEILKIGQLFIDQNSRTVTVNGKVVDLTPTEFKLLALFMKHPEQVFSRLQLVEKTHGYAFEGYERTVDSHIKNLRKKINDSPGEPRYIKTVYGVGYKMAGDSNAQSAR